MPMRLPTFAVALALPVAALAQPPAAKPAPAAQLPAGQSAPAAQPAPAAQSAPAAQPAPATEARQASPQPASAEAMALARQLVDITTGDRAATLQAISTPMVGMMQQMGVTDPAKAHALVEEAVLPTLSDHLDGLIDMQAQSYATLLSVDDLKGALAFYGTPAGRDLLAAQPQLARGKIAAMTQWIRSVQPELLGKVQKMRHDHGWDKG